MHRSGRALRWIVLGVAAAIAVAVIVVRSLRHAAPAAVSASPTTAATMPSVAPPTTENSKPSPARLLSYMDVVRADVPDLPTTQPLVLPLNLSEAAHLRLSDPIYLDSRRHLWVTRADAPPVAAVLSQLEEQSDYVVPEKVLFVHWEVDADNQLTPRLIVPKPGGGEEIVSAKTRIPIGAARDYAWDLAQSWRNQIIVPSTTGVSVFHFERAVGGGGWVAVEDYQELLGSPSAHSPASRQSSMPASTRGSLDATPLPQMLYDGQGFLVWIPWEHGQPGGDGAVRYVDGAWHRLGPEQGWPQKILHLVPLLGGSVMQLIVDGDGIRLGVAELGGANVDRKAIEQLVDQLGAASPKMRDAAFASLTRYGPSIRPILRELVNDLDPESRARVGQLLRQQVQPLLGPLTLLGKKLELITRHRDGGAVFYAEAGVSIASAEGDPIEQVPAWLAIRPGKSVEVLPRQLVQDLKPGHCQIIAVAGHDDDWVVVSDADGPRRFFGNGFSKLLRKDESAFTDLVGVDHRGRWLFHRAGDLSETLVLDPTIPDPRPRLPVWNYTTADEVGWDKDNWPAVKQGGITSRLEAEGWAALAPGEALLTRPDQIPPSAPSGPLRPATSPTTRATTRPAATRAVSGPMTGESAGDGPPLLIAPDGTRYFDGVMELKVVSPDGLASSWELPDIATGKKPVHLIRDKSGVLFLFNQPGRVLRIKPTPGQREPFKVDATFTRNIPSVASPTRIWLDPAGRIIMAYENRLAILFPAGYIPPAIRDKILDPDEAE